MSKRQALFSCAECPTAGKMFKLDQSSSSLNIHYRDCHWGISTFVCGECDLIFDNKTSMIRHMKWKHENDDSDGEDVLFSPGPSSPNATCTGNFGGIDSEDLGMEGTEAFQSCEVVRHPNLPQTKDMSHVAGEIVMELRSTARLTGAAVERFQSGYRKLLEAHTDIVKDKMFLTLKSKGMAEDDINEVLSDLHLFEDPFSELKTIESQLKFYEAKYGLVIPEECFIGSRIDNRLDPKTNEYVPTQVSESFQYISIIKTLKLILSNKTNFNNLFKDSVSKDGRLRSYVDGSDFKDHPFLLMHENVLHICLFYDDLEVAAALGSKTIIHKLGVFFFQILNGPAQLKSKISSIHLLALAYAEDLKKEGAFKKVLFKFVQEMKKLGSDEGVKIELDNAAFTLRALLFAVSADTLAAHQLLGFLSPSARHFCRLCMISRPIFRQDGNAEAPRRTRASHDQQVLEVESNERLSTQYGIKGECYLNQCPYFHAVDGSVFDAFHDLLEGVVPQVLKLVLRNFIYIRKLFSITDFNTRLASFSYGVPDSKNKPSVNFMKEMLTTRKPLKQTGTQMWCLMRVFPFLIADCVPEGDDHMETIFIVQDIMKIVFSFEVSQEDLTVLDNLVFKLLDNFKKQFVDANDEVQDDEEIDEDEDDNLEELDEPVNNVELDQGLHEDDNVEEIEEPNDNQQESSPRKKTKLKVHLFNKLHHLKHYSDLMRRKGCIVRLWCAKFEASLKVFRQYASICCNFKNTPKSMAQMFQLSHLWSLISSNEEDDQMEFGCQRHIIAEDSEHYNILLEAGISELSITNKAIINGEEYRPGLFIAFTNPTSRLPHFSIITDIYVVGKSTAYFVLKAWTVLGLSSKYNAYKILPNEASAPILKNVSSLVNFRPIAAWNSTSGDIYLSPRTQVL